jgi:hypothetical protein
VILKERTMANSRPNVQLFGYPVKLRGEQDVPGFRVKPLEEEVPGFHLNPDGSARRPAERRLNLPGYASPSLIAALTHPPLEPRIEAEPGLEVEVAQEPPQPPVWMERNRLGIPPELLMDPNLQPFYMDVPGRVLPYPRPWPLRLPDR